MRLIGACAVISGAFVVGVLKSVYCSLKAIGLSLQALVSALHVLTYKQSNVKCCLPNHLLNSAALRSHLIRRLLILSLIIGSCCAGCVQAALVS
jgi:hypothetical protein